MAGGYEFDNDGGKSNTEIVININDYEEELYLDNISLRTDIVHKDIPEDYAGAMLKRIENEQSLLRTGKYEFYIGAHGEVGLSEKIFSIITGVLLKLIGKQFSKEHVGKVIKTEIS